MNRFDEGRVTIIAELSANHAGSIDNALKTIQAAAEVGADAIKLQTYRADTITLDSEKEDFVVRGGTLWDGRKLYDLYEEAHTPWEWHAELFAEAAKHGLACFSSPFDRSAVDFLEQFDPPAMKIASFEITDVNLIEYAASKGRQMIMSTGIAAAEDIELALQTCRKVGNEDIVLLQCTSSYPAPIETANLNTMLDMARKYHVQVGLSDHTLGITAPVVATALGACMIEKHFILDRSLGGPDADFSLEPDQFEAMVNAVREAESALGEVNYDLTDRKRNSRHFSRSLFVAKDLSKGDVFTEENLRSVRPGTGLHPKHLHEILGKRSNRDLEAGTAMSLEFVLDD
jgi:pseudaminic acid synthase